MFTILMMILQAKANSGKYLLEKCQSEQYLHLYFKFFVKTILNFKVIVKSIIDPDDNFWTNSQLLTG